MKTFLVILIIVVLLVLCGIVAIREAELHELHRNRAAFVHIRDAHSKFGKDVIDALKDVDVEFEKEEERLKKELF